MYLVAFLKLRLDSAHRIQRLGVFFGGVGDTMESAEQMAREIVNANHVNSITVLPRVLRFDHDDIIEGLIVAEEGFESLVESMNDVASVVLCHRTQ